MIFRPSKEAVEGYFDSPVMSQSRLKLLPKGVDTFNASQDETEAETMFYEEKSYFILGQAAELKIQCGIGQFKDTYHMSDVKKPSDTLMSITQQIFDLQTRGKEPSEPFLLLNDPNVHEDIITAIEFHNYQPRWGRDVKLTKIKIECMEYYNDLINSFGKQILDLDESTIVDNIVSSWTNHPRTSKYFKDIDGIDYYYQLPIYFTYMGVEFKALLDILEIDHTNKTLRVLDLKTFGDFTIRFPSSIRKFRYDFQVAFYCIAVEEWAKSLPEYKLYTVVMPKFIVETTKPGKQGNPLVFECSRSLMQLALHGRRMIDNTEYINDSGKLISGHQVTNEIYGINDTVELYKWHLENSFEVDKSVYIADEFNRPLVVDWEGVAK